MEQEELRREIYEKQKSILQSLQPEVHLRSNPSLSPTRDTRHPITPSHVPISASAAHAIPPIGANSTGYSAVQGRSINTSPLPLSPHPPLGPHVQAHAHTVHASHVVQPYVPMCSPNNITSSAVHPYAPTALIPPLSSSMRQFPVLPNISDRWAFNHSNLFKFFVNFNLFACNSILHVNNFMACFFRQITHITSSIGPCSNVTSLFRSPQKSLSVPRGDLSASSPGNTC
jgi:hypothetical protein